MFKKEVLDVLFDGTRQIEDKIQKIAGDLRLDGNYGKETRKETAHKFTGIGFVLLFIQVLPYLLFNLNIIDLFGPLSGFLEAIYFLVTMMLLTAGLYFLIISYIYSRPHTALLFVSIKERKKKLVAIFPGWDSVEAQQVVSAINRVHRRI